MFSKMKVTLINNRETGVVLAVLHLLLIVSVYGAALFPR
jgi:hypothetical protein